MPSPKESLPFDRAREAARHVGTVAIDCSRKSRAMASRRGMHHAWRAGAAALAELAAEGVDEAELAAAAAGSPRGQPNARRPAWTLVARPAHSEASEWALADGMGIVTHIAVSTFVTEGVRWIVDFKTGRRSPAARRR
jgi:hypothetical protein